MSTPSDPAALPSEYPPLEPLPEDVVPAAEQGNLAMLLDALRGGKAYRLSQVRHVETGALHTMVSVVTEELETGDPETDAVLRDQVIPNLPPVAPVALLLGEIEDVAAAYEMVDTGESEAPADLQA